MRRLISLSIVFSFTLTTTYAKDYHASAHQADAVVDVLLSHALTQDIDAKGCDHAVATIPQHGHARLKEKVLTFIQHSKPLVFTLVGFPFKSRNTEKNVLGVLPDQGERAALQRLQSLMDDVTRLYPPGAKIQIYTDGFAFCDVIGVPYETVRSYECALKDLAKDLPSLSIVTLQDLFPGHSFEQIQNQIKAESASSSLDHTQKEILKKRLLKEFDDPKGRAFLKRTTLSHIADMMHRRSQQINALYKRTFPESLALSVHYQSDLGKKIGLSLVAGTLTPWHGVAVQTKDGSFEIRRKSDVMRTHTLDSYQINGLTCYFYSH